MKVVWDETYGFSSLSEKTRNSNCFQMSLQRQDFLLSYLETLTDDWCSLIWANQTVGPTHFELKQKILLNVEHSNETIPDIRP